MIPGLEFVINQNSNLFPDNIENFPVMNSDLAWLKTVVVSGFNGWGKFCCDVYYFQFA